MQQKLTCLIFLVLLGAIESADLTTVSGDLTSLSTGSSGASSDLTSLSTGSTSELPSSLPPTTESTQPPTTASTSPTTTTKNIYSCLTNGVKDAKSVKTYDGTRLYGHYRYYHASSIQSCWQSCADEPKCVAMTFYGRWYDNCFLYDCGFTSGKDSGWVSYSLAPISV